MNKSKGKKNRLTVLYWGTYDKGKPRNRILLKGLQQNGVAVIECHRSIWHGTEDKSQIKSTWQKLLLLFSWLFSYPSLIIRYLKSPTHDCVVVGYLGHLDVLILWPFAKIRRKPLVWDAFISLYDTIVSDRKLLSPLNPLAILLSWFEWLACKSADSVILDTEAHADFFRKKYRLSKEKCVAVFVGAEQENFRPEKGKFDIEHKRSSRRELTLLFYGQFIPLHGIDVIINAAAKLKNQPHIKWILIGKGQEDRRIQEMVDSLAVKNITWLKWVDYKTLSSYIHRADICLGIFGVSDKAARVIPNKVFQILSCGKTLITRESPAILELAIEQNNGLLLVKPGSADSLVETILMLDTNRTIMTKEPHYNDIRQTISPEGVGTTFKKHLIAMLYPFD